MDSPAALIELGTVETVDAIAGGRTSTVEVVDAALARIAATDDTLRAWVAIDTDGARAQARERDEDVAAGRLAGPLHGVPIGIKDIVDVAGLPTTMGAAAFAHRQPTIDAAAVARLRAAGAVIVGKTVATQFAYKDPAPTTNPWSSEHTPGGSSSGSAAAVAARQVPAAIGTQTVGSILRPSAFCGVVGFKGTHGDVPMDGIFPLAPSLDHVGPIARSVADVAILHAVLADTPDRPAIARPPRLGVARELFALAEPATRANLEGTIAALAGAGAEVTEVAMPASFAALGEAGLVILQAEAAATHAPMFGAHASEYGPHIAALVEAGLGRSPAELEQAMAVRSAFRAAVVPILDGLDALLSPVAPGPAPLRASGTGDFALCAPWSTAGVPSIALPTGLDAAGLPLALQLTGSPSGVGRLLEAAAWVESRIGFRARPPAGVLA
jgi:aspartyl-tRNA(Asn)/glutamyl-tRNA(Gln) amidotransferase subunit A